MASDVLFGLRVFFSRTLFNYQAAHFDLGGSKMYTLGLNK